jgi:hypothetical protein
MSTLFDQPQDELRQPTVFIDAKTLLPLDQEHLEEFLRCKNDSKYFAERYLTIKDDKVLSWNLPDWMRRVVEVEAIDTSKLPIPTSAGATQRLINHIVSDRTHKVSCTTAAQLRDSGIASVTKNEQSWLEAAHALIARYLTNEANAEELRDFVEERVGGPAHQNSWGGLFIGAVRKGLLTNLEVYVRSTRPASHGRKIPVYRINK